MLQVLAFVVGVAFALGALVLAVVTLFAIEDKSIAGVLGGLMSCPVCMTMAAIFLAYAGGA